MTDEEKAFRMTALTEMFVGFGQPIVAERLKYYGNLTKCIPFAVFPQAVRAAAMSVRGGFVPGPGDIIAAAVDLAPGERSEVGGITDPNWLQQGRRGRAATERPREIGPRGEGKSLREIAEEIR